MTVSKNTTVEFHSHGGFDNDGNSHYWMNDSVVDLDANTYSFKREESWGGQLIQGAPEGFKLNTYGVTEEYTREFKAPTKEQEETVYEAFKHIRALFARYPHKSALSFFKYWQEQAFLKNLRDARVALEDTDAYDTKYSVHYFILPQMNILIKANYMEAPYGQNSRIEFSETELKG
jgi:hypothetical protein